LGHRGAPGLAGVLAVARRTVAVTCALLTLVANAAFPATQATQATPPTALATRTTAVIRVDGRLDEDAWQQAKPIGKLIQREPLAGAEASETTDVRILYNDQALYIAILCHDRSPGGIVSTQLARDADLDVDDRITVVLDTFYDHRNGFFFQVNPSGARADGQISNNAETLGRDWDGIWNAAAQITSDGWVAEIEIPFKTLRFRPGQAVWGFNVERQIKRRQEIDRWTAARQNIWIGNLAEAGRLEGLNGLVQGEGLDVRPYLSGSAADDGRAVAGGVDLFKNIASNLNAAMTVNTDFAETEADLRQVNLTRFPLFFPEKRAFFLEGAGVFDVAGLANTTDLRPFFSRRVGLLETLAVPVRLGLKLTGRQGDYNVGVLDVETGGLRDTALSSGSVERQNLFAARVSRNIFDQSWVGGIVTHGDPTGVGDNTLVGTDARLATSTFRGNKNLALEMFLMGTDDGTSGKRDGAGGLRLDYPNDRWDLAINWRQIGEHFQPALGFVPRAGIRKSDVSLAFQPRPDAWGVRQVFVEINPVVITNLQNRLESASVFTAPFNVRLESGDHVEWDYVPTFERLDEPFEIARGVVIPSGLYRWTRFQAVVNTATKRRWVVDASFGSGGFYAGTLHQLQVGVTLKPSAHVVVAGRAEQNDVVLPQGRFSTQILTLSGDYNFTPNLSWANLAQYDNESRVAGLQSRMRWILQPGNDLFLVLNRGWEKSLLEDRFQPVFDRGSVKLQYTLRF
jgi:uncharacterized protein DUF5916/cellulose/xylan binding protein with CBM9 domain